MTQFTDLLTVFSESNLISVWVCAHVCVECEHNLQMPTDKYKELSEILLSETQQPHKHDFKAHDLHMFLYI